MQNKRAGQINYALKFCILITIVLMVFSSIRLNFQKNRPSSLINKRHFLPMFFLFLPLTNKHKNDLPG